ncbi:MAG: hypothetical protein ACK5NN_11765 [Sphingomonadaceae bacterium]
MFARFRAGLLLAPACVLLASCGGDDSSSNTATAPTPAPTVTPTPSPTPAPTPTPTTSPGVTGAFSNPDDGNIPDRGRHPVAFPTAIGFGGATAVRSSNAVVYKINSLEDTANPGDGKITYRECALALPVTAPYNIPSGRPRYCVFDVSGAIILQSQAWITTPQIYIAGQTSPGGIEFRLGSNYNPVDSLIDTRRGGDHMILRHVRVRTGEHPTRPSDNGDPIRLNSTSYQILDHVSTMFGTDESLEADCTNCTVQWSIIGPNICLNSGHSSGLHCKTFFLKPSGNVTLAYNLSQHGEQRGVNIAVGKNPATAGTAMQADIFNNVIYNFVSEGGLISNQFGSPYANYFGNVYFRGPRYNGSDGNYLAAFYTGADRVGFGFRMAMQDNVTPTARVAGQFGQSVSDSYRNAAGFHSTASPSSVCGVNASGGRDCSVTGLGVIQSGSFVMAPGNRSTGTESWMITSPMQAMRSVLAFAGADLCRDGSCRDNVDQLYVDDVRSCDKPPYLFDTGWTSTVAASGGFARLSNTGGPKADSDNDGMPDDWENRFKNTNPNVWDANSDGDGDGYPNIEEYLSYLAQDDQRYRGIFSAGTGALPDYNCGRPMF